MAYRAQSSNNGGLVRSTSLWFYSFDESSTPAVLMIRHECAKDRALLIQLGLTTGGVKAMPLLEHQDQRYNT